MLAAFCLCLPQGDHLCRESLPVVGSTTHTVPCLLGMEWGPGLQLQDGALLGVPLLLFLQPPVHLLDRAAPTPPALAPPSWCLQALGS